jgi:hypothetical protein
MPRPAKTPQQRAADVAAAAAKLAALVQDAQSKSAALGWDSGPARDAWDAVEQAGAIVHRQSRILSGKSRGG